MYWDRFDIAAAYYLYYCDYHSGQWSPEYARLCRILRYFRPSPMVECLDRLSDNAQEIYHRLETTSHRAPIRGK
jgi:hypothetical protein